MPLSEHEQALLEQLERALAADDPGLASRLKGGRLPSRSRIIAASVLLGLGLAAAVAGIRLDLVLLVVAGVVLAVAAGLGILAALRAPVPSDVRGRPVGAQRPAPSRVGVRERAPRVMPPTPRERVGHRFMTRLERRWEARRNQRP